MSLKNPRRAKASGGTGPQRKNAASVTLARSLGSFLFFSATSQLAKRIVRAMLAVPAMNTNAKGGYDARLFERGGGLWNAVSRSRRHRDVFINTAVSTLHAAYVAVHVVKQWYEDAVQPNKAVGLWPSKKSTPSALLNGRVHRAEKMLPVATGYFLYDTLDMYLCGMLTTDMFVHHAAMIFGCLVALIRGVGQPYMFLASTAEVNTVFLHLRKMMCLCGMKRTHPKIFATNWMFLLTSFVWSRFYVHGFALLQTVRLFRKHQILSLCGTISGLPIYVLNFNLFYKLMMKDLF